MGGTIKLGMPRWARAVMEHRAIAAVMNVLQQPVVAGFLYVSAGAASD